MIYYLVLTLFMADGSVAGQKQAVYGLAECERKQYNLIEEINNSNYMPEGVVHITVSCITPEQAGDMVM